MKYVSMIFSFPLGNPTQRKEKKSSPFIDLVRRRAQVTPTNKTEKNRKSMSLFVTFLPTFTIFC